ncbi:hypothetical protein AB5J62_23265 [Amycolatopsis sp. cg5]|uniref:hypothetical protein n=1 Tax=Amycolatopsis sp. cg5 TaxID=3238802 RepID=UPI0035266630
MVDAMKLARAEPEHLPASATVEAAEVYAMLDSLGDVGGALNSGNPDRLAKLYGDLHLEMLYDNEKEALDVRTSFRSG